MLPLHGSCAAPVQCTFFSAAAPLRQLGVIAGKKSGGSGSSHERSEEPRREPAWG